MTRLAQSIVAFTFSVASQSSYGDWAELGIAVQCNTKEDLFSVVSVVRTSSPEFDVPPAKGHRKIKLGINQRYRCSLRSTNIEMRMDVFPPQERGWGQGSGVIHIDRLLVGRELVIAQSTNFNWRISDEEVLTNIRVTRNGDVYKIKLCYSSGWSWENPYSNPNCTETDIKEANFRSSGRANAARRSP